MNKRICKNIYCQKVLPYYLNGNRDYCPDGCADDNKLRMLNKQNKQKREENHIAKMDNILEELYDKVGPQQLSVLLYYNVWVLTGKSVFWNLRFNLRKYI